MVRGAELSVLPVDSSSGPRTHQPPVTLAPRDPILFWQHKHTGIKPFKNDQITGAKRTKGGPSGERKPEVFTLRRGDVAAALLPPQVPTTKHLPGRKHS